MAEASSYQIILKIARLSFPKLFVPTSSIADGPKKYRASFLMDPETKEGAANIKKCEDTIARLKKDTWKSKADKIRIKEDRLCFGDGDVMGLNQEGELFDGYEGMMVIKAANGKKPTVVDKDRSPIDESDDRIYGGCFVNAVVRLYTVTGEDKGGNGIFASLEAVQYKRKGESFGAASVDPDDVFDDESDEDEDEDEDMI